MILQKLTEPNVIEHLNHIWFLDYDGIRKTSFNTF